MSLPIHERHEIIFLSNQSKGPQLNHADVAKAVHCSIYTVKYGLDRWKQSKDLTDSNRSGRPPCNYSETRPTNNFACQRKDIYHRTRYFKQAESARGSGEWKNSAPAFE